MRPLRHHLTHLFTLGGQATEQIKTIEQKTRGLNILCSLWNLVVALCPESTLVLLHSMANLGRRSTAPSVTSALWNYIFART